MDDKDFAFMKKPLSNKEEKEFSDFLKSRKIKAIKIKGAKKIKVLHEQ